MHTIIESQKKATRQAWVRACQFEGIDPNSSFVIFSPDNHHGKDYDLLARGLCHLPELIAHIKKDEI